MKLAVGFITYNENTSKYLPFFLPSLKTSLGLAMAPTDYKILAADNSDSENNPNRQLINKNYSDIDYFWNGINLGFAKAYNLMITKAVALGAEYFLMINPDTILAPESLRHLLAAIEADANLGAVAPRILKWDFINNVRTNVIDSDGLFMTRNGRFSDRHQGQTTLALPAAAVENDEIFGFTGAAVLLRLEALKDIAFNNQGRAEYLDELMFMYKEDVDLSYRLRLAAWPLKLEPTAIIYHDRTASPQGESWRQIAANRQQTSRYVKRGSFLNQWILTVKYCRRSYSRAVKWRALKIRINVKDLEKIMVS